MAAERRGTNGRAAVNVKRFKLDGRQPPTPPKPSVLKAPVSPGRGFSFAAWAPIANYPGTVRIG